LFKPNRDTGRAAYYLIRCQAATGSWTKRRQWETQPKWFNSARERERPTAAGGGVRPCSDRMQSAALW